MRLSAPEGMEKGQIHDGGGRGDVHELEGERDGEERGSCCEVYRDWKGKGIF